MGIHDGVHEYVFPSKVIGGSEWRPLTPPLWPSRPDRDTHRLIDALAGGSTGRGGVHKVDMEPWLGRGRSGERGDRTRVACLCRRHRTHWEIDSADEGKVLVHAGGHLACLVGCVGVVERGEGRYRVDGYDDKNAGFERSSVESFVVAQPMGHGAQGRGLPEESGWKVEGEGRR